MLIKNKIVAVVQARMQSTRLPNKSLLKLHGYSVIDWVNRGIHQSKKIDDYVYALPENFKDDILEKHLTKIDQNVFRGSEEDVLLRVLSAALAFSANYVVRVCADNPFVSGIEIDKLIDYYFNNSFSYVYNHIPLNNNYPNGIGAEIVSIDILKKINNQAVKQDHREHIFNYIWENPSEFSIGTFNPTNKNLCYPRLKIDLDTYADYEFLQKAKININMKTSNLIAEFIKFKNEN